MTTISLPAHTPWFDGSTLPRAATVGSPDDWPIIALLPERTVDGEVSFRDVLLMPGTSVSVLDEYPEGRPVPDELRLVVIRVEEGQHRGRVVEVPWYRIQKAENVGSSSGPRESAPGG